MVKCSSLTTSLSRDPLTVNSPLTSSMLMLDVTYSELIKRWVSYVMGVFYVEDGSLEATSAVLEESPNPTLYC